MEGRKDRGTAVPWPVLAGTDTHHNTRGPVTLRCLSLQMLGSAGDIELCPLPRLQGCLQGPWPQHVAKGGCCLRGLGFFLLLFISPLSFGIHLSCPCPSDTQVSTSKCCSLLLSPSTNPPTQNRVRKLGFRWKWPVRGDKVGLQRERVISLTCLVSLHPFKPTYKSNEGADRDKARATQPY